MRRREYSAQAYEPLFARCDSENGYAGGRVWEGEYGVEALLWAARYAA